MNRLTFFFIAIAIAFAANSQEFTCSDNLFVKNAANISSSINLTNPGGFWHLSAPRTQDFPVNKMSFYWNPNQPPQGDESTYDEIMTFTTSGRVGIGVSDPSKKLHVSGKIQGTDIWGNDGRAEYPSSLNLKNNTGFWHISGPRTQEDWGNNISIFWATGNTENDYVYSRKFTILENGNVGIGKSKPDCLLDVNGFVKATGATFNGDVLLKGTGGFDGDYDKAKLSLGDGYNFIQSEWGRGVTIGTFGFSNGVFIGGKKVGIGCTDPAEVLDVNGRLVIRGSDFILGTNDGISSGEKKGNRALVHADNDELQINYGGDFEGGTRISGNNLQVDGKVNIGTQKSNEDYLLGVSGTIGAKEVIVEIDSWADYVFDDDYSLRSLSEVESFVKANRHLPDVPDASQVKSEGVGVGEMNRILLQKVEELTLYIIEQEKRISELENREK